MTVIAPGLSPALRKIDLRPGLGPVDFRLEPGASLRVRFVDGSGAPIPGAFVSIAGWRGGQSLYNTKHPNVLDTQIPRRADAEGRYEWTWAPADAVAYRVNGKGCVELEVELIADGTEQTVTLEPTLRISGTVTDAATGRPIDRFSAIPVVEFRPDFLLVERRGATRFAGGRYAIDRDRADVAHRVRIEADGYRSAMSGTFRVGDPVPTFDARLDPAPPVRGRVVDPSGRPVEGARVYLATASQGIDHGELGLGEDDLVSTLAPTPTDPLGDFAFPAQFEPYTVLVVHDRGYAEASRSPEQSPGELVVERWARVEGRLFQEGRPVPSAWVTLTPIRPATIGAPRFQGGLAAKTDDQGHFAFSRVPPVPAKLQADLSVWRDDQITSSQSVPLDLRPGEHAAVDLGGSGTALKGRVVLTGEAASGIDLHHSLNWLIRKASGVEPPAELRSLGFDARDGWDPLWADTAEGRSYLDTLDHYFVTLDRDGSFLISGVPAGEYELALRPYEPPEGGCLVRPIGGRVVRFRVSKEDAASPSLDLGTIEVEAVRGPAVGEQVPPLAIETLDGTEVTLGDLRGRYVLLDVRATWCGPCVAGLPAMRRLHDRYAADGRLAVLGLALDEAPAAVRRLVEQSGLPWPQGTLSGAAGAEVLRRFAIGSVPTYLLIGPDGRLLHRGFAVEEIEGGLRRTLR